MPLFFKKKKPNQDESPPKKRDTVTLTCPECQHRQDEPRMAISTYCRGCGSHYKVSDGKAVPTVKNPSNPFARINGDGIKPRLRPASPKDTKQSSGKAPHAGTPGAVPAPARTSATATTSPEPGRHAASPASVIVRKAAASTGLLQTQAPLRAVRCFECDKIHQAPAEASSTLCPACGSYIGLKNYEIRDNWNQRIQTRGNVTIHKKATVTGITVRCHHMLVHGALTGSVDCSGDFTLRSHGKIMGKVHCKRLIIEKRAKVDFANPVECEDAIIDGTVSGHFTCHGKLHLKKKATLTGDIKVATMAVDEGASHHGRITIG